MAGKTGVHPINMETSTETRGWMALVKVERGIRVWYEAGSASLKA
jgi:hypothetical protein